MLSQVVFIIRMSVTNVVSHLGHICFYMLKELKFYSLVNGFTVREMWKSFPPNLCVTMKWFNIHFEIIYCNCSEKGTWIKCYQPHVITLLHSLSTLPFFRLRLHLIIMTLFLTDEDIEIEIVDEEPAFLRGQTKLSVSMSPVKIVKV